MEQPVQHVIFTYDPRIEIEEFLANHYSPPPLYATLGAFLSTAGVKVDMFNIRDLIHVATPAIDQVDHSAEISHNAEMIKYLSGFITQKTLVIHNRGLFNEMVWRLPDVPQKLRFDQRISTQTSPLEDKLNSMLYTYFPLYTHGVYVPVSDSHKNIRRKDMLPLVAEQLGVASPIHWPITRWDEAIYPAVVKNPLGKGTSHAMYVTHPSELVEVPFLTDESLIQEYIRPKTNFPSHFRTIQIGKKVIGGYLAYNPESEFNALSGRATTTPLGSGHFFVQTNKKQYDHPELTDNMVLDMYGITLGAIPPKLKQSAIRVGEYCQGQGCQSVACDWIADNDEHYYLIDVNKDPSPLSIERSFPHIKLASADQPSWKTAAAVTGLSLLGYDY